MSMGGKGGGKGKGQTSTSESRLLGGLASRFEQEARPSREGALDQLSSILNYGADALGPSMGGPSNYPGAGGSQSPKKLTKADVLGAYSKFDIGKGEDVNRILGGLPEEFTLDELKKGADLSGLSGRSNQAWISSVGELERLSNSRGSKFGVGASAPALLPIAQTAIERSKQATSQSVQNIINQSASLKGAGAANPFFQNIIAQTKVLGDQQTSQIPSRIVEQYLTNVLPLAFGQSPTAVQGLSNAAGVNASLIQGSQQAGAAGGAATTQALGSIAAAIAAAAIMT